MIFKERTYSVLVVSQSSKFYESITPMLPSSDYYPVRHALSASEARRAILDGSIDIVLINAPLPDEFGTALACDICENTDAGVLLFVKTEIYDDVYNKVYESGVMVISKPASSVMVSQTLRILCSSRERIRGMEARQASVEEKIAEIRVVNKAKWLLIECLNMNESQAHKYIEKQAMDMRKSKREVAENIIKTYS